MSVFAMMLAGVIVAGEPAECGSLNGAPAPEGLTAATTELFDVAGLPAGALNCDTVEAAAVQRDLIGEIDGSQFVLGLYDGEAVVAGAPPPGAAEGSGPFYWFLQCSYDATADQRVCLLQQGDLTVFLVNGLQKVLVGKSHRGLSEVIARVDDRAPVTVTSANLDAMPAGELISSFRQGAIVRTRYTHRFDGRQDATINLKGFSAGYRLLEAMDGAYRAP